MRYSKPIIYQNSIFDITYSKLKEKGIKILLFDLDNTIIPFYDKIVLTTTKEFFRNLKLDFQIIIVSNSLEKRVKMIASQLEVDYISFALKPSLQALKKILRKYPINKNEMLIIGDQLLTDLKAGSNFGIDTILVTPLAQKELWITKINRFREEKTWKILEKEYGIRKGEYYE